MSSGLVTVNNDLYVKGNIYYSGSSYSYAPGNTGEQPSVSSFSPASENTGYQVANSENKETNEIEEVVVPTVANKVGDKTNSNSVNLSNQKAVVETIKQSSNMPDNLNDMQSIAKTQADLASLESIFNNYQQSIDIGLSQLLSLIHI